MLRTLSMPDRKYDGIGKCIFCCDPKQTKLTVEHIIPLALSGIGEMLIKDGSCASCNGRLNELYENPALQNDLKGVRAILELKRRKKKRPLTLPEVTVLAEDDTKVKVSMSADIYPSIASFVLLPPPGLLTGVNRGSSIESLRVKIVDLAPDRKKWASAEWGTSMVAGALPMVVVKIAYSYAIAEKGIKAFDGDDIRDLLMGRRDDTYNFVGGASDKEHLPRRHLHQLFIRRRGKFMTVVVHLFASFSGPAWEVVIGRSL